MPQRWSTWYFLTEPSVFIITIYHSYRLLLFIRFISYFFLIFCFPNISGVLHWSCDGCHFLTSCLSLLCTSPAREALQGVLSILRMEMLGAEWGRWCCHGRWRLEVHITTGTGLFAGRATATRGVPVHTSTLATCHFPVVRREGGRGLGKDKKRFWKELGQKKEEERNARKELCIRKKEKRPKGGQGDNKYKSMEGGNTPRHRMKTGDNRRKVERKVSYSHIQSVKKDIYVKYEGKEEDNWVKVDLSKKKSCSQK